MWRTFWLILEQPKGGKWFQKHICFKKSTKMQTSPRRAVQREDGQWREPWPGSLSPQVKPCLEDSASYWENNFNPGLVGWDCNSISFVSMVQTQNWSNRWTWRGHSKFWENFRGPSRNKTRWSIIVINHLYTLETILRENLELQTIFNFPFSFHVCCACSRGCMCTCVCRLVGGGLRNPSFLLRQHPSWFLWQGLLLGWACQLG